MVRTRQTEIEIDLAADSVARASVAELARGDVNRRLEAANRLRHATEALVTELVGEARDQGATWADIGDVLGVSTQAAHQKYRWAVVDISDSAPPHRRDHDGDGDRRPDRGDGDTTGRDVRGPGDQG